MTSIRYFAYCLYDSHQYFMKYLHVYIVTAKFNNFLFLYPIFMNLSFTVLFVKTIYFF